MGEDPEFRRTMLTTALIVALFLVTLPLGIAYAASGQISSPVQGGITINILPIQASADINGNGKVDHNDLLAVIKKLNSPPLGAAREDINHDGAIDVLDLTIVARYLGQVVEI